METHTETVRASDGSHVELATIVHNGVAHTNMGSVVAADGSLIVGYVARDKATGRYYLTTWAGEFMFIELRPVSTWKRRNGLLSGHVHAWTATVNGRRYHGRNGGAGMLLRLRSKVSS